METYLHLLRHIKSHGLSKADRTGKGTVSCFGYQLRFDLGAGFPLVTTKKLHLPSIVHELLWFLSGETNIGYLNSKKITIWNEWADQEGNLGPIYGKQWRQWETRDGRTIDQVSWVINEIRSNPNSRRLIVSAWNVGDLVKMALPPCHAFFQFYVGQGRLSCHLYQRSVDSFLGLPFNIASYALLTHMIAQQCDLGVGELIISAGDCHIYLDHMDKVDLQLSRTPCPLPRLKILRCPDSISLYQFGDFVFEGYVAHPHIKADVAV